MGMQKLLPVKSTLPKTVPVSPVEAASILAHYGLDKKSSVAFSLLETRKIRADLAARAEAAEKTYQRALNTLHYLRQATVQIGTAATQVDSIQKRMRPDVKQGRPPWKPVKPWMDRKGQEDQSELFVTWNEGFTDHARRLLGRPPLLEGESELYYANMFSAIAACFGKLHQWDPFLISDAAAATWEMRRLREASEIVTACYFRMKACQLGKCEEGANSDDVLIGALEKAGISLGEVSAITLCELAEILDTLDDEVERLAARRLRTFRELVMLRARSTRSEYLNARDLELSRKHDWVPIK